MKSNQLEFNEFALVELTDLQLSRVNGGSALTYWAGYAFGATVGLLADVVAAGALAVKLLGESDPTSFTVES